MNQMIKVSKVLSALVLILLVGCQSNIVEDKDQDILIEEVQDYNSAEASRFAGITSNEITHLGKVLFYDKRISTTGSVSCASCHQQELAFAQSVKHSLGIGGQQSDRNSPTIINSAFSEGLFWDQSSTSLADLALKPVQNHKEMGFFNLEAFQDRIESLDYYDPLFKAAFGEDKISSFQAGVAIAEFCKQLVSFDSDFDNQELNSLEEAGKNLFVSKGCDNCHGLMGGNLIGLDNNFAADGLLYTGGSSFGDLINIGLDVKYADQGRFLITGIESDKGKFKVPSLRNVELTAPYMHDGRFNTLDEVLDFYRFGIKNHPNLDHRLKDHTGRATSIEMSESEKQQIIAFLRTLTSKKILSDPMFSSPFLKE